MGNGGRLLPEKWQVTGDRWQVGSCGFLNLMSCVWNLASVVWICEQRIQAIWQTKSVKIKKPRQEPWLYGKKSVILILLFNKFHKRYGIISLKLYKVNSFWECRGLNFSFFYQFTFANQLTCWTIYLKTCFSRILSHFNY